MSLPVLSPVSKMSKVILPVTGSPGNITDTSFPFGVYVSQQYWSEDQINTFKTGALEQVAFVYKRLGGDVLDIELVETQVYAAYEEACLEYSYLINLHQSKNALPFALGGSTSSFNSDGQISGSDGNANANLAFPKMSFTYAKNISLSVSSEVGLNGNEPIYSASINTKPSVQDYDLQAAVSASASQYGWNIEAT